MYSTIRCFLNSIKTSGIKNKQELLRAKTLFEGEQKERSRLGRELHDGIGSMLLAMNRQLEQYKSKHCAAGEDRDLDQIITMLNSTTRELRNTVHNLIPETLVLQGLEEAINNFCQQINREKKLEIQLYINGNWSEVNNDISLNIFRIVQELVQNIIKHSSATIAAINIVLLDGHVKMIVEDNGKGINKLSKSKGTGLKNINWRVASLEGIMSVESIVDKGTIIHISIPYQHTMA
ncbi:sensor histidine kinase [Taibaiella chishuiensis]|uniref:sensor histidine kinase n=1 Tax=Taibaiella chishuiensis TaxID=1434707 RepID=UPI0015E644BC|nr:histidine kinase [Taibaiella chishuiensis]